MNSPIKTLIHSLAISFAILLTTTTNAQTDRVRTANGSLAGKVVDTSRESISLETDERVETIDVVNVIGVLFEGEPSGLSQARINIANGGYRTAQETLQETQLSQTTNRFLTDDFAFYQAECEARLAINKQTDPREAGRQLVAYQKKYPTSFHYYQSVETLGDLLFSMDRYDRAIQQYEILNKAPWVRYQSRASYLSGLVRQEQGSHAAAIALFDEAIATQGEGEAFETQRLDAQLAKAKSLAETKKQAEAIELIREVIKAANKEEERGQYALAAGYNALGKYYLAEGDKTNAMLAFLRVDYLYDQSKAVHAESLYHLVSLWRSSGEPETAQMTLSKLRRLYGGTKWALLANGHKIMTTF